MNYLLSWRDSTKAVDILKLINIDLFYIPEQTLEHGYLEYLINIHTNDTISMRKN